MNERVNLVWIRSRRDVRGFALVDAADYDRVRPHRWFYMDGYAASPQTGPMHRFLLGLERGDPRVVHHVNERKTDNRRGNLTVCANKSAANMLPHPKRDAACRYRRAA